MEFGGEIFLHPPTNNPSPPKIKNLSQTKQAYHLPKIRKMYNKPRQNPVKYETK
jgi:hypothetical protein